PALAGLSVPYWTTKSNAAFVGMGLDTDKNQLLRAVLESIAFRVHQIMGLIQENETITTLSVDGGVSKNNFLINYLSELSEISIIKPKESEITALGGCYLAGLGLGVWSDLDQIKKIKKDQVIIKNDIDRANIVKYEKWKEIVTKIIDI
ncbi:MAG: glycerol kinase, partial [Spirochaetes bacterium]